MSLGIPVVATNLPEVVKFDDFVFVANDENEFIELIENALKDNIEERNKLRRAKAENYSWESIAEDVSKKILYPNKYGKN
jgi:glycosyltransferase involved in cell wall biosynthesis